jgi:outer membrane protein assembly factor BamB
MAGLEPGIRPDEFSAELADFKVRKVRKFNRLQGVGYGGSIDQALLLHKGVLYFGCFDHHVRAISAADGSLIWKFKARNSIGESSPVLCNDTIYIGSYDHNMYALDVHTGKMRWKFKTEGVIGMNATVHDGIVYFGSFDKNVYALDADSGSLIWKFRTYEEVDSTPAVHDGKLFIGSFDHNLYCLDAKKGNLLWKFPTQGEIYNANPFTIHKGIIYFGSFDNYLRAVRIEDAKELWRFRLGFYGTAASPVLHKDILYQETRDGSLIALTLEGKEMWRFKTSKVIALPFIHEDRIYIGSEDQNMYCLRLQDGKVIWKFPTQGGVWWCPAVWKNLVCFSSWDCHVYAADKNTGEEVWRFNSGSEPSYLPPMTEGFELVLDIPESEVREDVKEKAYDLDLAGEETSGAAYKSRITYQVSTQYASKGKYQVDSDEEEF